MLSGIHLRIRFCQTILKLACGLAALCDDRFKRLCWIGRDQTFGAYNLVILILAYDVMHISAPCRFL